jgi:DNA primase
MTARGDGAERRALEVDGRAVLLSNPDKVLYPATGFSKRDLVDYYLAVAPALLPYLAGAVAREVAREDPAGVTDRLPLAERAGKVLVDWRQNDPSRSVIAPRRRDPPSRAQVAACERLRRRQDVNHAGRPPRRLSRLPGREPHACGAPRRIAGLRQVPPPALRRHAG